MEFNNYYDPGKYSNDHHKPNYYSGSSGDSDDVVSMGTWVMVLILTGIPIINIIAVLVMAFGSGNKNIKNYGKAALIIIGISILLGILLAACSAF
ncbi:hypothetical protein SAMN05660462_00867 [Proteiniborus ethanoligenes]|uniref:Uncharacterized protein n=1 Tax=Proteiniborus ethanoligenes TaxID=415015 RepID=A0A1H3MLF8_9FIRM|nr:hypothetical protein [Proteiniborus ethanoligenes]TAH63909.1 MAG: hypothetical protein EWM50_00920 [Gottschalkiaceae bacterium]SDY77541.1 hypothetical protein SAMN05660462_00867 [Proteiniborus ethanoligenes]